MLGYFRISTYYTVIYIGWEGKTMVVHTEYKYNTSYAVLREILIDCGVVEGDIIDNSPSSIYVRTKKCGDVEFKVKDNISYYQIKLIEQELKAIYM